VTATPIREYTLTDYLTNFKARRAAGTLFPRECEVIDRLTDEEIQSVDIRSVMWCVWLQHNDTPVSEIPQEWWQAVTAGARLV